MSVKDPATVARYARQHASLIEALATLTKCIESMPAPDENGQIQNVDYGYTGSVGRMHELIVQASVIAEYLA